MSETAQIKKRVTCTVTGTKGKETESDIFLPYRDKTGEAVKAVIRIPVTANAPDAGGKVFFEIESCTGNVRFLADGKETATKKSFCAPLRLDITEIADGTEHEITAEITKKPNGGRLYFGESSVITTPDSYFDIENRGDRGVAVTTAVTDSAVDIIVTAHVINPNNYDVVRYTLVSPDGSETVKTCKPTSPTCVFSPENVFMWNGQHESPLYTVKAELIRDVKLLDTAEVVFGVRKTHFKDGFLTLNGIKLPLNGIALRDASALERDGELFNKLDANCVKIPVLPETDAFLSECDKKGVAVWVDMTDCADDTDRTKREVQHLAAHPSMMFVSASGCGEKLFTEFADCVKANADGVFTAGDASFPNEETVTDAVPDVLAVTVSPDTPLSRFAELDILFSEFIAEHKAWHTAVFADPPEGIYDRHADDILRADCSQEFFSAWHEKFWQTFGIKKGVFGCFAGFLADDDRPAGRTGLVSSDRDDKKDAFWFYKAQFSAENFIKICSADVTSTYKKHTDVRVYTNSPSVEITVNGKSKALPAPEEISNCVYVFRNIKLKRKNNTIVVTAGDATDSTVIYRSKSKLKKI